MRQGGFVETILLVAGLVAIIGVGAYFLLSQRSVSPKATPSSQITNPSSSAASIADLDTEFDSIQLDSVDSDFKDIDSDLSRL